MHMWTACGLPCRSNFKGGNTILRTDRWVTMQVVTTCNATMCQFTSTEEKAYPRISIPSQWTNAGGSVVRMKGVEDAIKRFLLQPTAQMIKCKKCKKGDCLVQVDAGSIRLPSLLVSSKTSEQNGQSTEEDNIINIGNYQYTLVGRAWFRPMHYTCTWRVGGTWYYYDDLQGVNQVAAKFSPKGYSTRLMYYVLTAKPGVIFDGIAASKSASYGMSGLGGVIEQEGVVLSQS